MENAFGILWLITLFAAVVAFLDWRSRRRDRQSRDRVTRG
jgi:cbb3-type cytochrome oxidase subunit 3